MAAIEEQHARPDVDRELVLAGEVVIEPGEQQLFDSRVAIATIGVPGGGASKRSGSVMQKGS